MNPEECPLMREIEQLRAMLVELVLTTNPDLAHSWLGNVERSVANAHRRGDEQSVKILLGLQQMILERIAPPTGMNMQ